MKAFTYQVGQLYAEQVSIQQLVEQWGTPLYLYSESTLVDNWRSFDEAFGAHPHAICYSVKANSNLSVLNVLAKLGSGFDIVSQGELERVLKAQGSPEKIVFSGVGKLPQEMVRALEVGVGYFNVESEAELSQLNAIASQMGKKARIAIRVNPDIDPGTHPYISTGLKENKFGVEMQTALQLFLQAKQMPHLEITGIACHIGSQLTELSPFMLAFEKMQQLRQTLRTYDIELQHLDIGGGLGVAYEDGTSALPTPAAYGKAILAKLPPEDNIRLIIEPGRAIAANAGILVTRVIHLKSTPHKQFAIVDAAMNDLVRPALYQAKHTILPVIPHHSAPKMHYDVVGPVCETGDFLAKDCELALESNDLLAITVTGAYGFCMSSNYNSRPRAAEVMVLGDQARLIRRREDYETMMAGELL
ncbi:MAG: diaminopimelate decarboxylase [Gammaproteobacteria bacterium]